MKITLGGYTGHVDVDSDRDMAFYNELALALFRSSRYGEQNGLALTAKEHLNVAKQIVDALIECGYYQKLVASGFDPERINS